jgi:uncharacterized membrane protein
MVSGLVLLVGVFLACVVEAVEALTVILAVGTTRSWRAATQGLAAGMLCLSVIVVILGPALATIPLNGFRLVIGALLLVFGLQWLRKAILRASGLKTLRDETSIFASAQKLAQSARHSRRFAVDDWYAFTVAFKSVLLEGLEVAFIVITFGAGQHSLLPATIAALVAVALVAAAGAALRRPLSLVPENLLKFAVGLLLTSFGTFWSGEGAGVIWPGRDSAILVLLVCYIGVALLLVATLKHFTVASRRVQA